MRPRLTLDLEEVALPLPTDGQHINVCFHSLLDKILEVCLGVGNRREERGGWKKETERERVGGGEGGGGEIEWEKRRRGTKRPKEGGGEGERERERERENE